MMVLDLSKLSKQRTPEFGKASEKFVPGFIAYEIEKERQYPQQPLYISEDIPETIEKNREKNDKARVKRYIF